MSVAPKIEQFTGEIEEVTEGMIHVRVTSGGKIFIPVDSISDADAFRVKPGASVAVTITAGEDSGNQEWDIRFL